MRLNTRAVQVAVAAGSVFAAVLLLPTVVDRLRRQPVDTRRRGPLDDPQPTIDVIVPAYLEATVIGQKVTDLRTSFNAGDIVGRVVVVASDAATAQAAEDAGADLVVKTGRLGKAAAINVGVAGSAATIVAFTDANCRIEPVDWVRHLRSDLEVADLVSAVKVEVGGSEAALHSLDSLVRHRRSDVHDSAAVFGEFVAMRREDFRPLPDGIILDDVALGLSFGRRRLRVVLDSRIRTVEPAAPSREHWVRRVRIAEGLLAESLPGLTKLLGFPAGRLFAAHKLARVTVACAAFWTVVGSSALAVWPLSLVVLPIVGLSVLDFAGRIALPRALQLVVTPLGMQAVPVVAAIRLVRRRTAGGSRLSGALWEKIER